VSYKFQMIRPGDFFYFDHFLNKIQEMNPVKTYFQDLTLWSRPSPIGTIYEGVTPCALAQLDGLTRTWCVTLVATVSHQSNRANRTGTTESHHML
jgi:hypothetical protein